MSRRYCLYCGRVAHRCDCAQPDSRLQCFLSLADPPRAFVYAYRDTPYKRGVPPQIKQRERATMHRHRRQWYADLVATYGEHCMHCGISGELVVDHVLPVAKGGHSALNNLQLLCATCNTAKGKLMFDCRPSPPKHAAD